MRIALVHDYIKEYGGAERVLEALHEMYPKAPVFTTVYLPSFLGPHKERFKDWDIRTSWLQYIPFKQKLISPLRLLTPWVFAQFDFSSYDIVIVSATGAYFPNSMNKKSALQICYCHTPPRYLYGYATAREWKKNPALNVLGEVANHFLRMVDFNASKNIDYYIANSEEVAGRIKKFYREDATIIYPPVDVNSKFEIRLRPELRPRGNSKLKNSGGYFLAGGRLARPKHIDLIVRACRELDVPLKVFGKSFAGYGEELESRIKNHESRIEFVGEVTDEEKWELMQNAKAFLFASEDEDFGIIPVEAMAAGIPVIAYRSGGVKETVIEGKTGLFFDELTVESLVGAIKQFNNVTINPSDCIKQAEKFSKKRFIDAIVGFVEKALEKNK